MGICCWIKRIGKISCLLENYQKQTAEWRRWNTVSHNQRWKFQVLQCQCISQMHSNPSFIEICANWQIEIWTRRNWILMRIPPGYCRLEYERNSYSLDSASERQSDSACQADCNYQWNAGTYRGDLWAANKLTKLMDTNVLTGDQRNLLWNANCLIVCN